MSDDRTVVPPSPVSVAGPVVQSMASTPVPTVTSQVPARAKESGGGSSEPIPYVEVNAPAAGVETEPLPLEVKEWMDHSEKTVSLSNLPPITIASPPPNSTASSQTTGPVYVLPLGELETKKALHVGIHESIRWLATWCQRIVKKLGNQAQYRQV